MASPDSPTCPTCQAVLALGASGYDTFWSCPNGHGAVALDARLPQPKAAAGTAGDSP